jgi:diaminopimelate epimerase
LSWEKTAVISFRKMHGLGNDFVIIDHRQSGTILTTDQIRVIGNRHRGVGFDQLALLLPPSMAGADLQVRFFNTDGSEAGACGNASRCIARLFFEETGRDHGTLQTPAGLLPIWRDGKNAAGEELFAVDIAQPNFAWEKIPLSRAQDTLRLELSLGPLFEPSAVNVGNPHAVFFVDDVDTIDLPLWGPRVENHALFPQRINVEICQILGPHRMRMRVWERGAGITEACGSGACAAVVAGVRRGLIQRRAEVVLDGGTLTIEWRETDDRVILIGTASAVFAGQFSPEFMAA